MSVKAIDCATRLTAAEAAQLYKDGYRAVGRYLGYFAYGYAKAMTPEEVTAIKSAKLQILSIYETNPTHASYFTAAQGTKDAEVAELEASKLGQDPGTIIMYTVDYDAQPSDFPAIDAYVSALLAASKKYKPAIYGSYSVIEHLKTKFGAKVSLGQTCAWSGGKYDSAVMFYQSKTDTTVDGISADIDQINDTEGLWPKMGQPMLELNNNGSAVETLQTYLNTVINAGLKVDGVFGTATLDAVKKFQAEHGLTQDGIVGPSTWNALTAAYNAAKQAAAETKAPVSPPRQSPAPVSSAPSTNTPAPAKTPSTSQPGAVNNASQGVHVLVGPFPTQEAAQVAAQTIAHTLGYTTQV
jgi:peptidoglycan hydrolase-like protein with peptidoglycan-binding domain